MIHCLINQVEIEIGFGCLAVIDAHEQEVIDRSIDQLPREADQAVFPIGHGQGQPTGQLPGQLKKEVVRQHFESGLGILHDRFVEAVDLGRIDALNIVEARQTHESAARGGELSAAPY